MNKRVVAVRSRVALPSLPSHGPLSRQPPPGRAGPGEPPPRRRGNAAGAAPTLGPWSPGGTQPPPPAVPCGTAIPLPRPPSRPSPGNVGGMRAGAAGGPGGRARPAGQGLLSLQPRPRCRAVRDSAAPSRPRAAPGFPAPRETPAAASSRCRGRCYKAGRRPKPAASESCGSSPLLRMKLPSIKKAEVAYLAELSTLCCTIYSHLFLLI